MIADWAVQTPAVLLAIAVLFVPGLALVAALRLRGLALFALAPAASTVLLSVLAILFGFAGIAWTPATIALGVLVTLVVVWAAAILLGPRRRVARSGSRTLLWAGLAAGIVFGAVRIGLYIQDPVAISQSNDAVFHLSAIRWILETGTASSFDLTGVVGARGFYPGAWHAVTSTVALLSGATIPIAVNVVTLITATLVWPLGITWLVRQATGSQSTAAVAAVLSPALLTFPMLMTQWGVLYPNLLSVALLPAAVAVVVAAPGWIAGRGPVAAGGRGAALTIAALLGTLGAVAISQPATLLAWIILALAFATAWGMAHALRARGRQRVLFWTALAGIWVLAAFVWFMLTRSTTGSHWPPFRGKLAAVVDVVFNGQVMLPFAFAVSLFAIAGLVVAVRRPRLRWLAASWLVFAGLYIVVASIGQPWLRQWLLGAWYADPYRIASLAPVVVIPLAAIGIVSVVTWILDRLRRPQIAGGVSAGIAAVIVLVGLVTAPVVLMPKVIENEWDDESRYEIGSDTWLSSDERALLERLPEHVPAGSRVIGNPSTGTGFGYVMSGVDVYPRTWSHPRNTTWTTIQNELRDAGTDPAVCDALEVLGDPEFVLDFGVGEATPGRFILPGMTDFAGQPGFELVDQQGDASLWRLTACD
ncbi:DUF6541 family protein [Microbacterium sp. NPDC055357]